MKNGTEHDMTQGAVAVPLIGFTIPLVLGNFFQLFYNAVDSIIVGRYVGESALAAVGTSTPVSYTHLDVYKRQTLWSAMQHS